MRTVLISEQRLRQAINKLLREAEEKTSVRGVFENLMLLAEKHFLEYDPYWLAAASLALIEGREENFIDYIIYSIRSGGISYVAKNYNGQSWNVKVTRDQRAEIENQVRKRVALIKEIRPKLSIAFGEESEKFMLGRSSLTVLGETEKKKIEDLLQDPSMINTIVTSAGKTIRASGVDLAYDDAVDALTRGNFSKFLGKAVLVRPPKLYEEMSQEEKQLYSEMLSDNEEQIKLFKQWSKPPEAEILCVKNISDGPPIGLVYVYPNVTDTLETLREKNKEVFNWNKKNLSEIDLASPLADLRAARLSDIFLGVDEAMKIKPEWRFSSRLDSEKIDQIKSVLSAADNLDDGARFSATYFALVDLRSTLPPNKVYTLAGQKSAAKFLCVADSEMEKIKLAFADMNPDINMACKLAVADSLKIGLSVAGAQVIQASLPWVLSALGAAIGTASGGPAGTAAGFEMGQISGRVLNAALVIFENGITQMVPLAWGTAYFSRQEPPNYDAAGMCLIRLTINVVQTIVQALTPELASILPTGKISNLALSAISRETFINIAGLILDFYFSLEQADAINPGQKSEILSALSKLLPVWEKDLTPEEIKKMENQISVKIGLDIQKIDGLFSTFKNLRFTEQN